VVLPWSTWAMMAMFRMERIKGFGAMQKGAILAHKRLFS